MQNVDGLSGVFAGGADMGIGTETGIDLVCMNRHSFSIFECFLHQVITHSLEAPGKQSQLLAIGLAVGTGAGFNPVDLEW